MSSSLNEHRREAQEYILRAFIRLEIARELAQAMRECHNARSRYRSVKQEHDEQVRKLEVAEEHARWIERSALSSTRDDSA